MDFRVLAPVFIALILFIGYVAYTVHFVSECSGVTVQGVFGYECITGR